MYSFGQSGGAGERCAGRRCISRREPRRGLNGGLDHPGPERGATHPARVRGRRRHAAARQPSGEDSPRPRQPAGQRPLGHAQADAASRRLLPSRSHSTTGGAVLVRQPAQLLVDHRPQLAGASAAVSIRRRRSGVALLEPAAGGGRRPGLQRGAVGHAVQPRRRPRRAARWTPPAAPAPGRSPERRPRRRASRAGRGRQTPSTIGPCRRTSAANAASSPWAQECLQQPAVGRAVAPGRGTAARCKHARIPPVVSVAMALARCCGRRPVCTMNCPEGGRRVPFFRNASTSAKRRETVRFGCIKSN